MGLCITVRCPFVCPLSVCLFQHHSSKPTAAGLLLWAWRAENIERLLHGRRSGAAPCGWQCLVVSVRWKLNANSYLALAISAWQPLKSGTLSLYLSVPVLVLIPSVVTSRPTTASRPSNPLYPSPLAPQIRLLLVRVYKLYLFTYLLFSF